MIKNLIISSLYATGLVSAQLVPDTTGINALQTPMPSPLSTQRLNDVSPPSCPPYQPGMLFPREQMHCLPCPTLLPSGLYANDDKACASATPLGNTDSATDYSVTPTPKLEYIKVSSQPCNDWKCPLDTDMIIYQNRTVCVYSYEPIMIEGCVEFNANGGCLKMGLVPTCPRGGEVLNNKCRVISMPTWVECVSSSATPSMTLRVQESPSMTLKVVPSMTLRVQESPSSSPCVEWICPNSNIQPTYTNLTSTPVCIYNKYEASMTSRGVLSCPNGGYLLEKYCYLYEPSVSVPCETISESSSQTPKVAERTMSPSMTPKVQQESPSSTAKVVQVESPSMTPKYVTDYTAEPTEMHPYDPLPSQQTRESVSATPSASTNCNYWYCPTDYHTYVTGAGTACFSRINAPYDVIDAPSSPEGQSGGSYPRYYCVSPYALVDRAFCEHRMKALWYGCETASPTQTPYPSKKQRTNIAYITVKPKPSLVRISPKPVLVKDMVLTLMATDPTVVMDTISEVKDILSTMYNVSVGQIHIKGIRHKIMNAVWNMTLSETPRTTPMSRMLQQVGDQTLVDYSVNTTNPVISVDISPILNDYILRVIDPAIVQQYLGLNVSVNDIAYMLYSVADGIQIGGPNPAPSPSSSGDNNMSLGQLAGICIGAVAFASLLTAFIATSAANKRNKSANAKMFNSGNFVSVITPSNTNSTAIVNNKVYGMSNNIPNEYPPLPNMV